MKFFLEDLSHASEEEQRAQIDKAMHQGFSFWIIACILLLICFLLWAIVGFYLYRL